MWKVCRVIIRIKTKTEREKVHISHSQLRHETYEWTISRCSSHSQLLAKCNCISISHQLYLCTDALFLQAWHKLCTSKPTNNNWFFKAPLSSGKARYTAIQIIKMSTMYNMKTQRASSMNSWNPLCLDQHHANSHYENFKMYQRCFFSFSSVAQSCPTLCDPMNCSMPGLPVHHQLPEFTQIHVHRVSDAIQQSHPLSSPSPPAPNPSQH